MNLQCIDVRTIADYMGDRLSEPEREQMEAHLSECDECLEEFVLANAMLNDKELMEYEPGAADIVRTTLEKMGENIKRKVSEWVTALSPPAWHSQYASAMVRSTGTASPDIASMLVRKDINALQAEMYFEKTDSHRADISIKVFKDDEAVKNVGLTLLRDGRLVGGRHFLDRNDCAEFEGQPFGAYSLMLQNFSGAGERTPANPYIFEIDNAGFHEK